MKLGDLEWYKPPLMSRLTVRAWIQTSDLHAQLMLFKASRVRLLVAVHWGLWLKTRLSDINLLRAYDGRIWSSLEVTVYNIISSKTPFNFFCGNVHRHRIDRTCANRGVYPHKVMCAMNEWKCQEWRILYGFGIWDAEAAVARFRGFRGQGQAPRIPWL